MQRYRTFSMMLAIGCALGVSAQQPVGSFSANDPVVGESAKVVQTSKNATKTEEKLDFDSFKKKAQQGMREFADNTRDEMNDFRRQVLENYSKWLEGEWVKFEYIPAKQRYTEPKPSTMPSMNGEVNREGVTSVSGIDAMREALGSVVTTETQEKNLMGAINDDLLRSFTKSNDTKRIIKDAHYKWSNPDDNTPGDWFSFYDLEVRIPKYDFQIMGSMKPLNTTEDWSRVRRELAAQWNMLDNEHVGEVVGAEIRNLAREMNLNDYLTYELTRSYVNSKFPNASKMSRSALIHYLMLHQGQDVRFTTFDGGYVLLALPSPQSMFGLPSYLVKAGDSAMYAWLFDVDGDPYPDFAARPELRPDVFTPNIEAGITAGHPFDFRMNPLNIPKVMIPYIYALGNIELKGEVNSLLMPFVRRYPQMSTEGFAESTLDPDFREDLVRQVKEQLGNLSPLEATNKLLYFIQRGFEYRTDDEYHGYEKPYFIEENFFYDFNDCEDRSILFTYLLWNALGIETQLLAYPGHESASVALPEAINYGSYYYNYAGEPFVIADATYLDAPVGVAMPDYKNLLPDRIDLYYNETLEKQRKAEREARQAQNMENL